MALLTAKLPVRVLAMYVSDHLAVQRAEVHALQKTREAGSIRVGYGIATWPELVSDRRTAMTHPGVKVASNNNFCLALYDAFEHG